MTEDFVQGEDANMTIYNMLHKEMSLLVPIHVLTGKKKCDKIFLIIHGYLPR